MSHVRLGVSVHRDAPSMSVQFRNVRVAPVSKLGWMIIVAGFLKVAPDQRETYLHGCIDVARAARDAKGCIDFHLSADPIELDRINIFEQWDSVEAVEAFRGDGPSDGQESMILGANVVQYEIASSTSLT